MAPATAKRRAKPATANGPQVYSYGRFSRPSQAKGDSERRQTDRWEDAERYANKLELPFNQSLRMFDRGKSAFHGHHITNGVFGPFLDCVRQGEVAPGSVLVIEEIDRVSRLEPTKGLRLILDIVDAGITIYTPGDDTAYNSQSLNQQGKIWLLLAKLEAAHATSKKTSDRLKAAWEQKRKAAREQGKFSTSMVPEWFERVEDADGRRTAKLDTHGKPIAIRKAAKTIVQIFRWREKGIGPASIAKRLNESGLWQPPPRKKKGGKEDEKTSGWNSSYVAKILQNRAVIGECQMYRKVDGKRIPDGPPVDGYFPNLLAKYPGLFESLQRKRQSGPKSGGRNDTGRNVLTKLVKCAYCGESLHFRDDGDGRFYLHCKNGQLRKSKCLTPSPSIRYDGPEGCELAILDRIQQIKPEQVIPTQGEQVKLTQRLRAKIDRISATLEDNQDQIANFENQIGRTKDAHRRDSYEQRITALESEQRGLTKELSDTKSQLDKEQNDRESFKEKQANIAVLKDAITGDDEKAIQARQQLNSHLRDFIDRIEVFAVGHHPEMKNPERDPVRDYIDAALDEAGARLDRNDLQEHEKFVDWIASRRRTKHGRFLRVHFKMSEARRQDYRERWGQEPSGYIDVVPAESIGGRNLDLDSLWNRFKRRKNGGVR